MTSSIETGHLAPFWNDDYKSFPYIKQPVTEQEIQEWKQLGYDENNVKSFTGSMYDSRNPMPDWIDFIKQVFGLYNQTYTFYRMDTLEIMPVHSDHFRTYCRLNDCTPDQVYRVVVMLEDWKPGHYFEMNGVGHVNWKAGDWFKWKGDVPHAASNIGPESRYTLQITGLSVYVGQLNQLFKFNVPGIKDSPHDFPLIANDVLPKINLTNDSNIRAMVNMQCDYIAELDTINHSIDEQNLLNKDNLHFYLYEPLCSYHKDATINHTGTKHTQLFYSEFTEITPEELRAEELESIYNYAERNNLNNIIVHTCDYDVSNWYPKYSDRMKLICDDLFLKTQRPVIGLNTRFRNHLNKKFICLNWRFTRHRQLVSTFLAGEDGHLSWYYHSDFDLLKDNLYFDLSSWEQTHNRHYMKLMTGCDQLKLHGPYYVDKAASEQTETLVSYSANPWPKIEGFENGMSPALNNKIKDMLGQYYSESFVDIVNETRFAQPTANFSEKVFQAVQYMKPFIVVAPPKTLEYIRSFGFRTFNEFWDESYDDEYDHGKRLAKIFDVIQFILDTPLNDLANMYNDMQDIVEHNLQVYKDYISAR